MASSSATEHGSIRLGFRRLTRRSDPTSFRFHSVWTEATQLSPESSPDSAKTPKKVKTKMKTKTTNQFLNLVLKCYLRFTDGYSELGVPSFVKRGVTQPASESGEEIFLVAALCLSSERVKLVGELRREAKLVVDDANILLVLLIELGIFCSFRHGQSKNRVTRE